MTNPTPSPISELTAERLAEIRKAHAMLGFDIGCHSCVLLAEVDRLSAENADICQQALGSWTNGVRHGREMEAAKVVRFQADNERLKSALDGKVWEPTLEAALRKALVRCGWCLSMDDCSECREAHLLLDRLSPQEP